MELNCSEKFRANFRCMGERVDRRAAMGECEAMQYNAMQCNAMQCNAENRADEFEKMIEHAES